MTACVLSSSEYNALPTIKEASAIHDSFLKSHRLTDIGNIFLKHSVQTEWGLCLVHRHFDLEPNEVMLEQPVPQDAKFITKPVNINGISEPIHGTSYRFDVDHTLKPFEYCEGLDISLLNALRNDKFLDFLRDLFNTLVEWEINVYFGVAPMESIRNGVETTDHEKRENIVEAITDDDAPDGDGYVTTAWTFEDGEANSLMYCRRRTVCYMGYRGYHETYREHQNY